MKNLIQTLEKEKVSSLRGYSNGLNKSNENTYSLVLHVRNLSKEAYYPTDYFLLNFFLSLIDPAEEF